MQIQKFMRRVERDSSVVTTLGSQHPYQAVHLLFRFLKNQMFLISMGPAFTCKNMHAETDTQTKVNFRKRPEGTSGADSDLSDLD